MLSELPFHYQAVEFRIKQAVLPWETAHAHRLRREVFCVEQGIFEGSDHDQVDTRAQVLVALACIGGMPDQVVGTVRIHEDEPGVWSGSRLAVDAAYRKQSHLGATLIRLAVCSAHAQGCTTFLANVQSQNVPLFVRMHWTSLGELSLLGRPHHRMRADLAYYPPCDTPHTGFVTRPDPRRSPFNPTIQGAHHVSQAASHP
jgi:putative N-acetyltransferase (TIGR04045 family)